MSKFFVHSDDDFVYDKPFIPTLVDVPEIGTDGKSFMSRFCIETFLRPCSLLSFDDFSLSTLIKNGVSPKSLAIANDARIGFDDSVFDELDSRISEISDTLFVSSSN